MKKCVSCPRACAVDREAGEVGFCGVGQEYLIGSADLHFWEEPCISGSSGSGAIFFSGCNLRCVFCQNKQISRSPCGQRFSEDLLIEKMIELQSRGANNINLVTPTPYAISLAHTLKKVKPKLHIPIVYNCGGYESLEALRALDGLVDVYLPDFKYFSDELAAAYSSAPNYRAAASAALCEMFRQVGSFECDKDGIAQKGLIVRHLVLPDCRADSCDVLEHLAKILPSDKIMLSLMRQYTPEFADPSAPKNLRRRLTSFEYQSVLDLASSLGFNGFSQQKESASSVYTPRFNS